MLISTEYNYIYLSSVTEIDKFMLNLVNLSITSSRDSNNCLFLVTLIMGAEKSPRAREARDDRRKGWGEAA